ncbi:MAG: HAMP domain-containing histidine kinase [Candidatus Heimdallarchaeota archaeon]|nr:HAMP domain-containing histidine kinase [Candidatus Heimdallarchaeota archaeon]MCK4611976.1 HAMP domain-containing histidine kinase [Candidatus Heimdallarchaeota archaeon]
MVLLPFQQLHQLLQYIENSEIKNLLLNIFTHDFNNFQAAAKGYVEYLLLQEENLSNFATESLERARQSISKTINLITNLSVLMRYDLEYSYNLFPISLCETFIELEKIILELYPNKQIQLHINKDDFKGKTITADSLLLHLFLNLLINAISNDPNGRVKIEIKYEEKEEGSSIISVSDYGKGIKPEKRKELFTPYSQFKREGKGSGLGLFIVKTLVERYNGEVWIEDRVKGDYTQGTCVNLEFSRKKS